MCPARSPNPTKSNVEISKGVEEETQGGVTVAQGEGGIGLFLQQ